MSIIPAMAASDLNGKPFILSYEENDPTRPIIAVRHDPRENGLITPAVGMATGLSEEYIAAYPDHKFRRVQVIEPDKVIFWVYDRLPGALLYDSEYSEQVRGREVITTSRRVDAGTTADTGALVISSKVTPEDAAVSIRRSVTVASLPPTESWAMWDFVPIPLLVFSLAHSVICNATPAFKVITTPNKKGGASALRKHRVTVEYHTAYPNPDLSASTYALAAIEYEGKVINFSFSNCLNDALSYSGAATDGTCSWTELYDFPASTPTATAFFAGAWYVRSYDVKPWGTSGFRSVKTEFYSAAGNPAI